MQSRLPVLPVFQSGKAPVAISDTPVLPNAEDLRHKLYLDSGSSAIALALRLSDVQEGDEVLIPAYHCPTMASPAVALGAKVVFFRINEDLGFDMASIKECITPRSKALLVPHFFGAANDLTEIRTLCDGAQIRLIEDCAHMYFGVVGGDNVGTAGDYAVFSTRKFFAGADGGILASNIHGLAEGKISRRGFLSELKSVIDIGEESLGYDAIGPWRLPLLALLGLRSVGKRVLGRTAGRLETEPTLVASVPGTAATRIQSMSRASRRLFARSDITALCEARQRNFALLHNMLVESRKFRTLPELFARVQIPYMYPLIVDNPAIYMTLRADGWPIWRWDDSSRSCSVSEYYAQHLLQVPCHQSLGTDEIKALGSAILGYR